MEMAPLSLGQRKRKEGLWIMLPSGLRLVLPAEVKTTWHENGAGGSLTIQLTLNNMV